jgi:predicted ATPase
MREVNVDRDWRRAASTAREHRLLSVRFASISGLEDAEISCEPFITVFVGGNGTGKSTLLWVVRIATDGDLETLPFELQERFEGSTFDAEFAVGAQRVVVHSKVVNGRITRTLPVGFSLPRVEYVDLAGMARYLKTLFGGPGRSTTLREGVDPAESARNDIAQLNWLSRKEYESVQTFEIQPPSEGGSVSEALVPYFLVREQNTAQSYGIETMGMGELCIFIAHWRVSQFEPGSIILIDEPEASLPPWSQAALIRTLARATVRNAAMYVISTHSDHVVSRVPPAWLRLAYRVGGRTRLLHGPSIDKLNMSLDLHGSPDIFLLCEDRIADKLASELLGRSPEATWPNAEIIPVGSDSNITSIIDSSPMSRHFRIVGMYDGDRAGTLQPAAHSHRAFLPGRVSPELYLRAPILANRAAFCVGLGVDEARLDVVIASIAGADVHDWLQLLAERLLRSEDEIIRAAVSVAPQDDVERFGRSVGRAANFDRLVLELERIAGLRENDRPNAEVVNSLGVELKDAIADDSILLGQSWLSRARAVLARMQL